MKQFLAVILFSLFCSPLIYSQDTIVQKSGVNIFCKIQRDDSTSVYFTINKNGQHINTFLKKSDIETFKYGKTPEIPLSYFEKASIGLGFGMDYGGIGGNIVVYPQKNIGLFLGAGSAFAGFGYNLGVKLRLITDKHTSPISTYLIGMYGYNAAIAVSNASQYNKLFYGPSIGFGLDYKSYPAKKSYWTFLLLIPIRSSDVDNYITDLKNNHGIEFKNGLLPIAFSIGYRFILN